MSGTGGMPNVPPFPPEYRASGLLLHVTSLPSPYGIGDLGPSAFLWINRLQEAGQKWWQALPLGPTGYGNSPYQSLSSFAGNGLLISPCGLISDGLLETSDCEAHFLKTWSITIPSSLSSAAARKRVGQIQSWGAQGHAPRL
jgi:4-alpha-glucanotransferase